VREALLLHAEAAGGSAPPVVHEVFLTPGDRHAELLVLAERAGVPVSRVSDAALAGLAETVTPQGVVAVCGLRDVPLDVALAGPGAVSAGEPATTAAAPAPRLVVVLAAIRDPGNAGTVLRTADAAGADLVIFAGPSVDPHNGKCVRASAGSLFHLPVVRAGELPGALARLRAAGMQVLAADGAGADGLDELLDSGALARPSAWIFGNEAWGLPPEQAALADARVRVPIYGRAESLNLAAAAAVCLYAAARAQRRSPSAALPRTS